MRPTPVPVLSVPAWAPVKNSIKRGHVVPAVQLVPIAVRMLSRITLLPVESVLLSFETVSIAVPVALVGAVMLPRIETTDEGFATPTESGPLKEDVAVELEMIFPARN